LSELEFIKSETGEYPVLLLDDVMSELDEQRRCSLLDFVRRRIQTFITTTDPDMFRTMDGCSFIRIEKGKVQAHE
jgi:DNA replication and repair protein RecF